MKKLLYLLLAFSLTVSADMIPMSGGGFIGMSGGMGGGNSSSLGFRAYLDDSLQVQNGIGTLTHPANDTTDYQRLVPDHEDIYRAVKQNASRHYGARVVINLIPASGTGSASLAVSANKTVTVTAGDYVFSMGAGGGTATFSGTAGATGTLNADSTNRTSSAFTLTAGTFIVTASVETLVNLQLQDKSGSSTSTIPDEYVPTGVATGEELNPDVEFDSTDWTGAGTTTITGGEVVFTSGTYNVDYAYIAGSQINFVAGATYLIEYEIGDYVSGGFGVDIAGKQTLFSGKTSSGSSVVTVANNVTGAEEVRLQQNSPGTFDLLSLSIKRIDHGNNQDGQKSFNTENGNSVASNVVTQGTGALLGRNLISNNGLSNDTVIGTGGNYANTDDIGQGDAASELSVVSGNIRLNNGDGTAALVYHTLTTVAGRTYTAFVNFNHVGESNGKVSVGTSIGGTQLYNGLTLTNDQIIKFTFTATGTTSYLNFQNTLATINNGTEWVGFYVTPGIPLAGLMMEGAATNLFLNSTAPVTQDITLSTGLHTLSVHGTGSVTSSDNTATSTGHGAASDGTPITFNVSVGGSVTFTVSGSPDYVQVETGGVPTSPIVTAGTSVTRPASTDATIDDANINDPNFTLTVTVTPNHPSTALTGTQQVLTLGANAFLSYNHTSTRWEVTNGTTTATVTDTFTAGQSIVLKIRGSQSANELQISADATAGTAVAYSGSLPAGNITFAEMGGQANFKNVEIYRRDKGAGWLVE